MTIRIAILHGGPSDRQQHVVDRFNEEIYVALFINCSVPLSPEPRIEAQHAVYRLAMRPFVAGEFTRAPDVANQQVALYVYIGRNTEGAF